MELEKSPAVPLALGKDGTIRIAGSRVTLDAIVSEFRRGATAEQIQEDFPSISLTDIYSAIAYYLQHRQSVEQYLTDQQRESTKTRSTIEAAQDSASLRRRLRESRREPFR
jgi:uncharacterized protein (DUF433 family)